MTRLALKPDFSFFRKIALGAIGSRHVALDLELLGHRMVELERGAMDTKLWKDVKRKRIRIPDLVCRLCALRVESRAKTKTELSMSHSRSDHERAWDFGMVDGDVIAFPVCSAVDEEHWSIGRLEKSLSYWHERNWVQWRSQGKVNYVRTAHFRAAPQGRMHTKGVTEGSETTVMWKARFSRRNGVVEAVQGQRITIVRDGDGHRHTQTVPEPMRLVVAQGERVAINQVIASCVRPESDSDLQCPRILRERRLPQLLASRERTQRFTGVKLARLNGNDSVVPTIASLESDQEEDLYIRLEAAAYLVAVDGGKAEKIFGPYLANPDPQIQLETVIALGEAGTGGCVNLLGSILEDRQRPHFARSAAAWCLGRIGGQKACRHLIKAFEDVDPRLREEALEGIVTLGSDAAAVLLRGLRDANPAIAAGCAEALRQSDVVSDELVRVLSAQLSSQKPTVWAVWLTGHLPRERLAGTVADLQETVPELHYAVTLLWSFVESWISRRWELRPGARRPRGRKDGP